MSLALRRSVSAPYMVLILSLIDNRLEEFQEKYNQEFEERKRLETELKVLQVKVGDMTFIAQ